MENVSVYLPAKEVWEYFDAHEESLKKSLVLCAENTATGYGLYLTNTDDRPQLAVFRGEEEDPEKCSFLLDYADAVDTYDRLFSKYLLPVTEDKDDDGDIEGGIEEYEVSLREDELYSAFEDFLSVVMETGSPSDELGVEEVYEMMDAVLETLAADCGLDEIYRPTAYTDEDGLECRTNYPYMDVQKIR